jgi:hypothetical protein
MIILRRRLFPIAFGFILCTASRRRIRRQGVSLQSSRRRWRSGRAPGGGLIFSPLLTYTTPVVYIWFDRLAKRFRRSEIDLAELEMPEEA